MTENSSNTRIIISPCENNNCERKHIRAIHKSSIVNHNLHMSLSDSSILILNYYEVNKIIDAYMSLKKTYNLKGEYVSRMVIESLFKPRNSNFVNKFFTDIEVSCDDFVLFVCFFLFYHNEYIISILLIIAGVNSNLMITKEKVNRFFDCFNIDKYLLIDLDEYLNLYKITLPDYPQEAYYLKSFQYYLQRNTIMFDHLACLKHDISILTLDKKSVDMILIRKVYYNLLISENKMVNEISFLIMPKESCLSNIYRHIFTSKPHPFHCDFHVICESKTACGKVLTHIKRRYCYRRSSNALYFKTSILSKSVAVAQLKEGKICQHSLKDKLISVSSYDNNNKNVISPCDD